MSNFPVKTIIHGHFYQPPREDPWTNQIEEQHSAYPYKNWNIRITKECYAPNAYSRVLDDKGRIIDIINNYRYISFNFGPTLLNWLEKEYKEIYDLIIEADKISVEEHNGHGNAIAQIYNHVIMPLQDYEDKRTQIIWGLKDFEKRFGRKSEGLWLSETAVNYDTIDLLINFGIKYIILSPDQAKGYRKLTEDIWYDTHSHSHHINTNKVYKVIRNHGEIAVFYYDKGISTAISFEHLLFNAANLANRIISGKKENDLIVVATDGEVYGHHEPFGDMCLAKLIRDYYLLNNKIKLMNFGEYLEYFQPEYETSISQGDDGLGSSWSCYHGVGRWYRDCGCHTGGESHWNQKWRQPLRDAFNSIKKEIDIIYNDQLSDYVNDPAELRNDYIEFILDNYDSTKLNFLKKHLKKQVEKNEIIYILSLLESQKYALFMFTSCAWFFTELTGIETVQNIKYAYKSIYLLSNQTEKLKDIFEQKLDVVYSNIPKYFNGKWILYNWVYPYIQDFPQIVNNFVALVKTTGIDETKKFSIFDYFGYKNFNLNKIMMTKSIYEGSINIFNKKNFTNKDYIFIYREYEDRNHCIYILPKNEIEAYKNIKKEILNNNFDEKNHPKSLSVLTRENLTTDIKQFIIEFSFKDKKNEMVETGIRFFSDIKPLLKYYKEMHLNLPIIYKSFLKLIAESIFYDLSRKLADFPERKILIELLELFDLINYFSLSIDNEPIKEKFSEILYENIIEAKENIDSDFFKKTLILIEFCNKVNLILEKSKSENHIFFLLKKYIPVLIDKINSTDDIDLKEKYLAQFKNLVILADNFNINTEEVRRQFFDHFKNSNLLASFINK